MSLPSTNANGQSSIRNFFQPKTPSYVQPPAVSRAQAAPPVPPPPPSVAAVPSPTAEQNGPRSPLSPVPTTAPLTRPPSLHPQATISPILPEHVPALRRITSLLLPVNYPDSFYARLSDPLSSGAFSRVVLWSDPSDSNGSPKVIGGLVCRPEPSPFTSSSSRKSSSQPMTPSSQPNALYIQSLVLLSPYRQQGLAAALLDDVVRAAVTSPFVCEEVYAHVWTDNEDGLRWYLARGFTKHGQVNGYYFKLRPDSAWIVRRSIGPVASALGLNGAAALSSTGIETTIPPSTTAAAANLLTRQAPTPPALAATSGPGILSAPPRSNGPSPNRSPGTGGLSFQNARPETEWNDLPADMHASRSAASGPASNASSRSSSTAPRKKKDRAYPAAAFGK
ncbi:acyl-CoA N-acyltransferase [Daldinia decipiens]|uniref:acyl-CoA N-acyltransferase n=1 Tax=Daldinia decipiens TaxID=326647 RepID=UPI0020C49432|nr:acyl-CoA N-acyltransferase [Daldinia decipiens]KAI1654835.1 acyl-CoA N-acyltransferase [Daldinia decipiens]